MRDERRYLFAGSAHNWMRCSAANSYVYQLEAAVLRCGRDRADGIGTNLALGMELGIAYGGGRGMHGHLQPW